MQALQRGIIDLVKACLTKEKAEIKPDFDWEAAYEIGRKHDIIPMLYYGVAESGIQPPEEIQQKLRLMTIRCTVLDRNQRAEIEKIERSFEERGIDYLPLKGVAMKSRYPRSEMRTMGDADILIREEQYADIRIIMGELGFNEILESDHELVWDKPGMLHLELHKRLIPSYNKDYYAYYGDGWKLTQKTESTRYAMRAEEEFIYLFTHYAKHYRNGGVGIRQMADLFVFLRSYTELHFQYVETELGKLSLDAFYRNTRETLSVWFENGTNTDMTDFITDKIFSSGSFGIDEDHVFASGVRDATYLKPEQVKWHKRVRLIFPSAKALSQNYPILKRCKLLLPLIWVHRWVVVLLFKRGKIRYNFDKINTLTAENIQEYQAELNYVGLNFNYNAKK
ncbi:MAG: nucleotidyltransferase family protein [bacterium]|nr:nucleotidyltransferase family protein [bacterium]